jgi:hypothetical protein
MSINRALTIAAILVAAVAVVHLSRPQRQWKQPRVFVRETAYLKVDADPGGLKWTNYFRAACPHMAIVENPQRADYNIAVFWVKQGWYADVRRSDSARIYDDFSGKNPDAIELLRRSCKAIWVDVKDSGLPSQSSPVGRYALSYHPGNPNYALLLDTKTGVVWELRDETFKKGSFRKFERVSVDGLYESPDEEYIFK